MHGAFQVRPDKRIDLLIRLHVRAGSEFGIAKPVHRWLPDDFSRQPDAASKALAILFVQRDLAQRCVDEAGRVLRDQTRKAARIGGPSGKAEKRKKGRGSCEGLGKGSQFLVAIDVNS